MDKLKQLLKGVANSQLGEFLATRIRNKLVFGMLAVALIPLFVLGLAMYHASASALEAQAFRQLDAVRSIQAKQIADHFGSIKEDVAALSGNRNVAEALEAFSEASGGLKAEEDLDLETQTRFKNELRDYFGSEFATAYQQKTGKAPEWNDTWARTNDNLIRVQHQYLVKNPNGASEKGQYDPTDQGSVYDQVHATHHANFRSYLNRLGYSDLYLVDLESGDVLYSVTKRPGFLTSLKRGAFAQSKLGQAFREAALAESQDEVVLTDFEKFVPSFSEPASFAAAPVFAGEEKVGVVILQISLDPIKQILSERKGLGQTGETYVVGRDKLFRSESRFSSTASLVLNPKLRADTRAVNSALDGQEGTQVTRDYRGQEVLSSWTPIVLQATSDLHPDGVRWGLVSQMDLAEVQAPVFAMWKVFLIVAVGAGVLILIVSLMFANGLTRQTDAIMEMLSSIGIGDFDARAEVVSRDELGSVAVSLNSMCDNTLTLIQSREERDEIQGGIQILMEEVSEIAQGDLTIQANVNREVTGGIADSINFMISQLRDVVRRVKRATEQVSHSAHDIRSTTEHLSRGSEAQAAQILDTSSAIDEMSLSIGQVADNTDESAMVARQARECAHKGTQSVQDTIQGMNKIRDQVQDSAKRIKRLGESSQEIGEIVQLISDIADRTSILALNASIQAAMAGDAGQGFAVVAEEVERLAERSNEATKQISALIKAIQGETSEAISAMEESTREVVAGSTLAVQAGEALEEIDEVSSRLDELIHSISLATKQQARGAEALSKSMNEISGVTKQTAEGTKQAASAVGGLASLADELRSSVSAFKLPEDNGRMTQSLVDLRAEDLMGLPENESEKPVGASKK